VRSTDEIAVEATVRSLSPRLRWIVRRNLTAPEALIEDACQVAWSRWAALPAEARPGATLPWLVTTATRIALRMLRQERRTLPLEVVGELAELPSSAGDPAALAELHDRLAELRRLPRRQQRIVWLQGAGFRYDEISAATGDSTRTVERQLLRARRRLASQSSPAHPSPRAAPGQASPLPGIAPAGGRAGGAVAS
jgi:RNA polymerase sigma factor (sigma-70 family)